MKDQFVTYPIALKLKELGFNEKCLGFYAPLNTGQTLVQIETSEDFYGKSNKDLTSDNLTTAPLWQQAVAWVNQNTKVAVQERLDGWYVVRKNSGFEVNNKPLKIEQAILLALQD